MGEAIKKLRGLTSQLQSMQETAIVMHIAERPITYKHTTLTLLILLVGLSISFLVVLARKGKKMVVEINQLRESMRKQQSRSYRHHIQQIYEPMRPSRPRRTEIPMLEWRPSV